VNVRQNGALTNMNLFTMRSENCQCQSIKLAIVETTGTLRLAPPASAGNN
jgi:hypothetical protein